jgi:hypothetical protein
MKALAFGLAVLLGLVLLVVWGAPPGGPAAAAPAVQGCPACHGAAGREPALDAAAKKIKNHPAVAFKTVQQCAVCHAKGPTPPPFRTVLHRIHLNSAKFAATYKGTCTSCHNVDKATGTITVYGLEKKE